MEERWKPGRHKWFYNKEADRWECHLCTIATFEPESHEADCPCVCGGVGYKTHIASCPVVAKWKKEMSGV